MQAALSVVPAGLSVPRPGLLAGNIRGAGLVSFSAMGKGLEVRAVATNSYLSGSL